MAREIEIESFHCPEESRMAIVAKFDMSATAVMEQIGLIELIAEKIAQRYVDEHYAEVAAKLDQNAIASLAIADAGKKIAEEIRSRPTVLHDKETRTEVYQRGVLGGMRRVR